jgi:putative endonuclease
MRTAARRRVLTYLRGQRAERIALLWLLAKGYRPLARRYSAAGGEIDLVVKRGSTIAFVEVKARESMEAALASIDATKRRRFSRAARAWIARHPDLSGFTLRADAVFIAPGAFPRHVIAAFALDLGG